MKKTIAIIAAGLMSLCGIECRAQRFSLSTNLIDCAMLGTMNIEGAYSLSRHVSLTAGAKYNPFTYRKENPEKQFQLRQRSYSMGVRIWPWHAWSGWWIACKGRCQEYNFGGLVSPETSEGDRVGMGLYAGYTHMLSPHINIEFGLGGWAGMDFYRTYSCQVCGMTLAEGRKGFVLPDDIMIALVYVF